MPALTDSSTRGIVTKHIIVQWLKWFCEAGGAHLTKPGWSKPHTHSNPTSLALFRHKITLYRFNQGAHTIAGEGSNGSRGMSPLPPHFNHCHRPNCQPRYTPSPIPHIGRRVCTHFMSRQSYVRRLGWCEHDIGWQLNCSLQLIT